MLPFHRESTACEPTMKLSPVQTLPSLSNMSLPGALSAPGKLMFDSEGNVWTGDNFMVGSQAVDSLWNGNMSKFAPNGRALSPAPTGFAGGGLEGPGFGTAIDADDNV